MNFTRPLQIISKHYRPLRLAFLWVSDAFIVFMAVVVAVFLYTRVQPLSYGWPTIFAVVGTLFGVQLVVFLAFRIYSISFQYASLLLIVKVLAILAIALFLSFFLLNVLFPGLWPPLVAVLEALLSMVGTVFLRLAGLIYLELVGILERSGKQVLIYGGGETGKNLVLALKNHRPEGGDVRLKVIGFIDDDPKLKNRIIYGYKVLGDQGRLEGILARYQVDELIVAIPSLGGDKLRELRNRCRALNIVVKAVPSFYEIYNKQPESILSSLKKVEFEDLLRRPTRELPLEALEEHFREKTVMVIGGGGSIGSELVAQIIRLSPAKVIVADSSEYNLYQVEERFQNDCQKLVLRLVDAKIRARLATLFLEYSPQIVFHAAAYKHVHLVERNPVDSVLNNISGVKNSADLAHESGCEQFVFISSDKAVSPAGVMGATKRIGEMYVQSLNSRSKSRLFAVRFGNVFGSSGSLIASVVSRIERGEPVQLTHPDMTRYFMLLPEAVSLILEACLDAKGGEVFILDMGRPVKIVDLVTDLVLLLERQPGKEVPIEFIGPRPGEKIHEELFIDGLEKLHRKDGFYVSTSPLLDYNEINTVVEEMLAAGLENQVDRVLQCLRQAVVPPEGSVR